MVRMLVPCLDRYIAVCRRLREAAACLTYFLQLATGTLKLPPSLISLKDQEARVHVYTLCDHVIRPYAQIPEAVVKIMARKSSCAGQAQINTVVVLGQFDQ